MNSDTIGERYAIWAHELIHSYTANQQRIIAIDNVSFAIPWGGVTAIIGPSGSGKSTLLHLIGGLAKPIAGDIIVNKKNLRQLNGRQLAAFRNRDVGMIFQAFNLFPRMSIADNVYFPLYFDRTHEHRSDHVRELLKVVGLGHALHRFPDQLSGGEQQRVAIARALITNPPLILADEPTGNLDETTGQTVMSLLFQLARNYEKTLILVTHHREYALQADRRIYLENGHVLEEDGF
ncbi:MAG: ABC transporter ATP-binding protein [Chloroflexi bacterium]|nr:ABC transporter ATP-binding protein [Chloroflexota bacterium]